MSVLTVSACAALQPYLSVSLCSQGMDNVYFCGGARFNLRKFWAEHKAALPLHYAVYLSEVGCKRAAAANVESVFSGAGKFTEEAKSVGPLLLQRKVKLHYNWKYTFLRPTINEVCVRYKFKFHGVAATLAAAADVAATPAGVPAAAATPTAEEPTVVP